VAAFGGVDKIQNGGRCHGNQGAKNVAYLVPLDVDVVPNKFHQFLFGE
jgi:hypothetical protein